MPNATTPTREPRDATGQLADDIDAGGTLPDHVHAGDAAVVVLCTLAARLSRGEVAKLAATLPERIGTIVRYCPRPPGDAGESFDTDSFMERVGRRLRIAPPAARRLTQGVFAAVRVQLSAREVQDAASQLPKDLRALWLGDEPFAPSVPLAPVHAPEPPPPDEPLDLVGRGMLAEIEADGSLPEGESALAVASAVLGALTHRVSPGEARAFVDVLPPILKEQVAPAAPPDEASMARFDVCGAARRRRGATERLATRGRAADPARLRRGARPRAPARSGRHRQSAAARSQAALARPAALGQEAIDALGRARAVWCHRRSGVPADLPALEALVRRGDFEARSSASPIRRFTSTGCARACTTASRCGASIARRSPGFARSCAMCAATTATRRRSWRCARARRCRLASLLHGHPAGDVPCGRRELRAAELTANARIMVEKPFGRDLRQRVALDRPCARRSPKTPSSASTTSSAKSRSRTCSTSASPTALSSPCGTATTSSRCRSRWRNPSACAAAARSTKRRAHPRRDPEPPLAGGRVDRARGPPAAARACRDESARLLRRSCRSVGSASCAGSTVAIATSATSRPIRASRRSPRAHFHRRLALGGRAVYLRAGKALATTATEVWVTMRRPPRSPLGTARRARAITRAFVWVPT